METTKLTIRLPRRHVEFAKAYAKAHGITVTEFIDRLLWRLQASEKTELHPEVEAISGIVPPDVDAGSEYYQYLMAKHSP